MSSNAPQKMGKYNANKPLRVVFFVFNGFQLLDFSSASAVFEMANKCSGAKLYESSIVSLLGGVISASNGTQVVTLKAEEYFEVPIDLLFAIGGEEQALTAALRTRSLLDAFAKLSKNSRLNCSVCSGAFFLAYLGLLDYKCATTHWMAIEKLQSRFPLIDVQDNVLYTNDGNVLTSAGVSTGVDLALEIVSRQYDRTLSNAIAKRLVVSMHRPAYAPQIDTFPSKRKNSCTKFDELCTYLIDNLDKTISVEQMANRCAMSVRHFSRQFTLSLGISPQKFFNREKIHHAKQMINRGFSIEQAYKGVGFKTEQGFIKRFSDEFGITPNQYVNTMKLETSQPLYIAPMH